MSGSRWRYSPEKCDGDFCPGECDNCPKCWEDAEEEDNDSDKLLKNINKALELSATKHTLVDSICMNRRTIEQLRKLATYPVGAYIRKSTLCGLNLYVNNSIEDGAFVIYAQRNVHPIQLFNGEGLYKD